LLSTTVIDARAASACEESKTNKNLTGKTP
jgi:hypothetical protein